MQLVQQCFEFIVGDLITCASRTTGGTGRGRCHGIRGELALAVQLIEQGFELGVGDFIAGRLALGRRCGGRRCFGFGLGGIQRVEQQLEFVIGDVPCRAFFSHRLGNRLNHLFHSRCCRLGTGRFGQARQGRQQLRCGSGDFGALTDLAEHAVHRVQSFKHHVHQFRVDSPLTLAQDVEDVLGDVAALHQLIELEEAGAPFNSVKTAKNCIEQIRIIRPAFQLDQLFGQLL